MKLFTFQPDHHDFDHFVKFKCESIYLNAHGFASLLCRGLFVSKGGWGEGKMKARGVLGIPGGRLSL